jgi:hypothetical protein
VKNIIIFANIQKMEKFVDKEAVPKVETPRHSRKSGNLLLIVND